MNNLCHRLPRIIPFCLSHNLDIFFLDCYINERVLKLRNATGASIRAEYAYPSHVSVITRKDRLILYHSVFTLLYRMLWNCLSFVGCLFSWSMHTLSINSWFDYHLFWAKRYWWLYQTILKARYCILDKWHK